MFTGIIETTTKIKSVNKQEDGAVVAFALPAGWELELGDSVAINGVCSTVKELNQEQLSVEYMPETLRKTTFGQMVKNFCTTRLLEEEQSDGKRSFVGQNFVNLERALAVGDRINGHFVQGHVDGVGTVQDVTPDGDSLLLTIKVPQDLQKYIVHKGSVALDGVSLTITNVQDESFGVALVGYTREHTTLETLSVGDTVNIETDILARYITAQAQ